MTNPSNKSPASKTTAIKIVNAAIALAIALTVQVSTPEPASAGSRVKCTTTSYGTHCTKGVQVKFKCKVPVRKWIKRKSGAWVLRVVEDLQNCVRTSEKKCFTSKRSGRCTPR